MDIIRDTAPQKKKKTVKIVIGVVILAAITIFIQQLEPAAPTVNAATIFTDTVKQGTLVRQIRGPGTLVPEDRRVVTAVTSGRVESVHLLPGETVTPETILMTLSNPDVDEAALQAEQQLSNAESALIQLRVQLSTNLIQQEATLAQFERQYADAQRTYEVNQRLYDQNPELVAMAELERTRGEAEELARRVELEGERLELQRSSIDEQIQAQEDQIARLQEIVGFQRDRVASMVVRAAYSGVLAEVPPQEGEWVQAGGMLARVVGQGRLRAEIQIPQTQAQEIQVNQIANIDTRNDTIPGRVTRINPSVQNGSVTIEVSLPENLPPSARPDLSVDGNVIINRLEDVIMVGKPNIAQANRRIGVFMLVEGGEYAERVNVEVGVTSINEMEVRAGLQPGDIIISSDMSNFDNVDRVRIRR